MDAVLQSERDSGYRPVPDAIIGRLGNAELPACPSQGAKKGSRSQLGKLTAISATAAARAALSRKMPRSAGGQPYRWPNLFDPVAPCCRHADSVGADSVHETNTAVRM